MELTKRAQLPTQWPSCPHCGTRLNSRGFQQRSMLTLVGQVKWSRRVGRCPLKCHGSLRESGWNRSIKTRRLKPGAIQTKPACAGYSIKTTFHNRIWYRVSLDELLWIKPDQKTSDEVIKLGCLLAIFVPFEITSHLLEKLTGIKVCAQTIANWVKEKGRMATSKLSEELTAFSPRRKPQSWTAISWVTVNGFSFSGWWGDGAFSTPGKKSIWSNAMERSKSRDNSEMRSGFYPFR